MTDLAADTKAREATVDTGSRNEEHLVVFRLADEHFGLNIACVREIITWQAVTRLPRAPRFVEGVINLRGGVIPVIDLRKRFEMPEAEVGRETRIMVVEMSERTVGLVVDAVTEVLRVPADQVEPPPGAGVTGVDAAFLRGVAKVGGRLIVLLDLDLLLDRAEQAALRQSKALRAGQQEAS